MRSIWKELYGVNDYFVDVNLDLRVDADLKVDLYSSDRALNEFQRGLSFDSFVERLKYY